MGFLTRILLKMKTRFDNKVANETRFKERVWKDVPVDIWLRTMFSYARELIKQLFGRIAKGEEYRGAKKALMFQLGIPSWLYARMIDKTFGKNQDNVYKLIFPTDASKGISFTVAELRSSAFCERNVIVLEGSETLITLMRNDGFLSAYTGVTNLDLSESNTATQSILGCKMLAIPVKLGDINEYLLPKKVGKRSKFVRGNLATIAGKMNELSRSFVEVAIGETLFMCGNQVLWETILGPAHANTLMCTQNLNPFSHIHENEEAKKLFAFWYDPVNKRVEKADLVMLDLQIQRASKLATMVVGAATDADVLDEDADKETSAAAAAPSVATDGEAKTGDGPTLDLTLMDSDVLTKSGRTPGIERIPWDWSNIGGDAAGFDVAQRIYRRGTKGNTVSKRRGRGQPNMLISHKSSSGSKESKIQLWEPPVLRMSNILGLTVNFRIDEQLAAVLSRLDAKISIDINCIVVDRLSGSKICDIADIRRIGTCRRFLIDADRKAASASALKPIEQKIFNLQKTLRIEPRPLTAADISNVKTLELESQEIVAPPAEQQTRWPSAEGCVIADRDTVTGRRALGALRPFTKQPAVAMRSAAGEQRATEKQCAAEEQRAAVDQRAAKGRCAASMQRFAMVERAAQTWFMRRVVQQQRTVQERRTASRQRTEQERRAGQERRAEEERVAEQAVAHAHGQQLAALARSETRVERQEPLPRQRLVEQPRAAKGPLAATAAPAPQEWQPVLTGPRLLGTLLDAQKRARALDAMVFGTPGPPEVGRAVEAA